MEQLELPGFGEDQALKDARRLAQFEMALVGGWYFTRQQLEAEGKSSEQVTETLDQMLEQLAWEHRAAGRGIPEPKPTYDWSDERKTKRLLGSLDEKTLKHIAYGMQHTPLSKEVRKDMVPVELLAVEAALGYLKASYCPPAEFTVGKDSYNPFRLGELDVEEAYSKLASFGFGMDTQGFAQIKKAQGIDVKPGEFKERVRMMRVDTVKEMYENLDRHPVFYDCTREGYVPIGINDTHKDARSAARRKKGYISDILGMLR